MLLVHPVNQCVAVNLPLIDVAICHLEEIAVDRVANHNSIQMVVRAPSNMVLVEVNMTELKVIIKINSNNHNGNNVISGVVAVAAR